MAGWTPEKLKAWQAIKAEHEDRAAKIQEYFDTHECTPEMMEMLEDMSTGKDPVENAYFLEMVIGGYLTVSRGTDGKLSFSTRFARVNPKWLRNILIRAHWKLLDLKDDIASVFAS